MTDQINFYSTRGEYGCFSNFSRHPVTIYGQRWPTSEHAFQAQKYAGVDVKRYKLVAKAGGPGEAAKLGRDRKHKIRKDWESIKYQVMREIVLAKFKQNDDIKKILLGTGSTKLVEHTERDAIWGDGGDGSGKNWLGKILMSVREELGYPLDRYRGEAIKVGDITLHPTGPKNYSWEKDGEKITIQHEYEAYWIWWAEVPMVKLHPSLHDRFSAAIERSRGQDCTKPEHAVKEALAAIRAFKDGTI